MKFKSNNATKVYLAAAYFPDYNREKCQYQEMSGTIRDFIASMNKTDFVFIGQTPMPQLARENRETLPTVNQNTA
jgi:hypothetical protein